MFGSFIGFGRVHQKRAVSKASATTIWLLRGRGKGYRWFQKKIILQTDFEGKNFLQGHTWGKDVQHWKKFLSWLEKLNLIPWRRKKIHPKPNHPYPLPSKVKWSNETEIKWKANESRRLCLLEFVCFVLFLKGAVSRLSPAHIVIIRHRN